MKVVQRNLQPRFEPGCLMFGWAPVLEHGCDCLFEIDLTIHWRFWHVVVVGMVVCLIHSILGAIQKLVYGRRIRRTTLRPPIFILGHWRTGTTLLHELLSLDPRHGYPTSYQ